MNIFVLDNDPRTAAQYHCDKHVVKMVLETAQILCSVNHEAGRPAPYRKTHVNHPCTVWARASSANYAWLVELGKALSDEYTWRYGKTHKSSAVIDLLTSPPDGIPRGPLTPFALAMPEQYRCDDPVQSYRDYYVKEKGHILSYKRRNTPDFVNLPVVTA